MHEGNIALDQVLMADILPPDRVYGQQHPVFHFFFYKGVGCSRVVFLSTLMQLQNLPGQFRSWSMLEVLDRMWPATKL